MPEVRHNENKRTLMLKVEHNKMFYSKLPNIQNMIRQTGFEQNDHNSSSPKFVTKENLAQNGSKIMESKI